MSSEFESWLCNRLSEFNADGEVFSTYILGILDNDSETAQEKEDNLADLLDGLGLDDGVPEPCQRIKAEIWSKWTHSKADSSSKSSSSPSDSKVKALGAAVVAHAESQTKAYVASRGHHSAQDDKDREAIKAAVLAQFNNATEESDGSEEDTGGEDEDEFKNSNAEAVAKAQAEQKEKCRAAAMAKKEKDKEDREKQKKEQEDRKKKAQEKAQKGERRR